MPAPSIESEPFMTLVVELRRVPIGTPPWGERSEVFFEGTATSSCWDGTRAASGIDHITRGTNGIARIDVHVFVTDPGGDEVVAYRGHGRGGPDGVLEGVTFETASERLAWLNDTVAVGRATIDGSQLTVELYRVTA
jgi:hypothetical protein